MSKTEIEKGHSRGIEQCFSTKLSFQAEPKQIYLAKAVIIMAMGKTVNVFITAG